jgi:hypothetical protein
LFSIGKVFMNNLKVNAISLAVATCFSGAVSAQSNWQGGYAGLSADLLNTTVNNGWCAPAPGTICATPNNSLGNTGLNFGVFGGYNLQKDSTVYGMEFDLKLGNLNKQTNYTPSSNESTAVGIPSSSKLSVSSISSLRGRLGIVRGNTLFSLNTGIAYVSAKFTSSSINNPSGGSQSLSQFGPVIGATLEHKLSNSMSLRLGVSQYFFGRSFNVENLGGGQPNPNTMSNQVKINGITNFTAGLSYQF